MKIKIMDFIKKNYIFFLVFLVVAIWHTQMPMDGDGIWFSEQLDQMSYGEYIVKRYHSWSSRLLIETGLLFFTRHMTLWKILDTIIWTFIVYGVVKLLDEHYTPNFAIFLCLLFSCYDIRALDTAGWIAVIMNYVWPFACFCGLLLIMKKLFLGREVRWYLGVAGIVLDVFACNQEQAALAVAGVCICCILYMFCEKIQISRWIWGYMFTTILSLIFVMTCPGNGSRKTVEISTYFKEFSELTIWNKLDIGVTSICHMIIFESNYLFVIFLMLLCVAIWRKPIAIWKKYMAVIPFVGTVVMGYLLGEVARLVPEVVYMKDSLQQKGTYLSGKEWSVLTIIFYIGIMLFVLWDVFLIFCDNKQDGFVLLAVLGIGFATRVIMGFAPSVWVSGSRTFFFWQMALLVCSGYLWRRCLSEKEKKKLLIPIVILSGLSFALNTGSLFQGVV